MDVTELVDSLLERLIHMEPLHRMFALWIFCLGGILVACQASQVGEPNGLQWTKLTPERACVLNPLFPCVLLSFHG